MLTAVVLVYLLGLSPRVLVGLWRIDREDDQEQKFDDQSHCIMFHFVSGGVLRTTQDTKRQHEGRRLTPAQSASMCSGFGHALAKPGAKR
jgi:hypothetical protein